MRQKKIVPLQARLILIFTLIFLSLILQVSISYKFLSDTMTDNTIQSYQEVITQTSLHIDASINTYGKLTKNIMANERVQTALSDLVGDSSKKAESYQAVRDELAMLTLLEENINSIHIIPKDGATISYNFVSHYTDYDAAIASEWYEDIEQSYGNLIWLTSVDASKSNIGNDKTKVFTAVRKIFSLSTGEELALALVYIDEKQLYDIISDVESGTNLIIYLLDKNNQVVLGTNEEDVGKFFSIDALNHDKYFLVENQSSTTEWTLIGLVPKSVFGEALKQYNVFFIALGLVSFLVIVLVSWMISRSIVVPIINITNGMSRVKKGDFDVRITQHENSEIGMLSKHFNDMTEELKFFIDKVYKQELSKRDAELKAIQAQIDPHFLYNTLDTIYWMLVVDDNEEVADMVVSLSDILRYSISEGEDFVTVSEDVKHLENYLRIHKARFNEKLTYNIHMDEDILDVKIPKLLIQPIVENAIKHGIKDKSTEGEIHIIGKCEEDQLILCVRDNGIGMRKSKIREVLEGTAKVEDDSHTGIGLKSVHKRIKLIYGEQYGITIDSVPNQYTLVTLRLKLDY